MFSVAFAVCLGMPSCRESHHHPIKQLANLPQLDRLTRASNAPYRGKTKIATTALLGLVHRCVSLLHQIGHVVSIIGIDADADAGCTGDRVAVNRVGRCECFQQLVCDGADVFLALGIGHEYDEFVTAKPGNGVHCAHAGFGTLRHCLEKFVTRTVTQGVIDHFEVIQIEVKQGYFGAQTYRPFDGLLKPVQQETAVGQAVSES